MNKKLIISTILILASLSLLGAFIFAHLNPATLENIKEILPSYQGEALKPLTPETTQMAAEDKNLILEQMKTKTIENYYFGLRYDETADTFMVDVYEGTPAQAAEKVTAYLKELGVRQPDKLNLQYNGPKNYDQYEPVPQEKINEILDRYSK